MSHCTSNPIRFKGVKGHKVEAIFSGQTITSDGGGLPLRAVDEKLNLLSRGARYFDDARRKASCGVHAAVDYSRCVGCGDAGYLYVQAESAQKSGRCAAGINCLTKFLPAIIKNNSYLIIIFNGVLTMKKFICTVCGYVHEGSEPPAVCPPCDAQASKFKEMKKDEELVFADEHVIGVAKDADPEIIEGLRQNFAGECAEVGMYLAMSRQADREGYPEIAEAYKRYAFEEAEHAAKFAELLGEVLDTSTQKNLEMRVLAEHGATRGKKDLAAKAKQLNLDAIHDTVHEMCKDEARHGKGFQGLLARYF